MIGAELLLGRSWFGPSGTPGWWTGNIWSEHCSQYFADPYSFSHVAHGILFYGLLWVCVPRLRLSTRYLIALTMEAAWEVLENSPIIIDRYRETTIALGYSGDSIFNSASDLFMMSLGFLVAWRLPVWATVLILLLMEVGCALWVRDNLFLNIVMLIHPVEAIKSWQLGAQPPLP